MTDLEGTYLVWLDFRETGLTVEELEDLILNKARLWLDSGKIFGKTFGLVAFSGRKWYNEEDTIRRLIRVSAFAEIESQITIYGEKGSYAKG